MQSPCGSSPVSAALPFDSTTACSAVPRTPAVQARSPHVFTPSCRCPQVTALAAKDDVEDDLVDRVLADGDPDGQTLDMTDVDAMDPR